jgi:hypothetical protein
LAGGAAKSRALAGEIAAAAPAGVPFLDADRVVRVSDIDGMHPDGAMPALTDAFAAASRAHCPG